MGLGAVLGQAGGGIEAGDNYYLAFMLCSAALLAAVVLYGFSKDAAMAGRRPAGDRKRLIFDYPPGMSVRGQAHVIFPLADQGQVQHLGRFHGQNRGGWKNTTAEELRPEPP